MVTKIYSLIIGRNIINIFELFYTLYKLSSINCIKDSGKPT